MPRRTAHAIMKRLSPIFSYIQQQKNNFKSLKISFILSTFHFGHIISSKTMLETQTIGKRSNCVLIECSNQIVRVEIFMCRSAKHVDDKCLH